MIEWLGMDVWALVMFGTLIVTLLIGYPVALTLGAIALFFGYIFLGLEFFDLLPLRIWGIMTNFTLLAVPLFIFMGIILEKSGLAEELLETMGLLFGSLRGGLALSIVMVGAILAATTGVVGATVVTMGVVALPTMLKNGYSPVLATGTIAASGTLGQIIPPSVILILLGDMIGIPVGRLFVGAVIPGLLLVLAYIFYIGLKAWVDPNSAPALVGKDHVWNVKLLLQVFKSVLPALALIIAVLGTIFFGIASPTESAAIGAFGALLLAVGHRRLTWQLLMDAAQHTGRLTSMVFIILVGATTFGLVFRGMQGDILVKELLTQLPGDKWGFLLASQALIFFLGFFLDFLEICFIVVPILSPIAQHFHFDLLWFGVLIAVNLQTSFLTPPFGFSLFYLKAVVPPSIHIGIIYRGIIPFVILQVIVLLLLAFFPEVTLWLPDQVDKLSKF